MIYCPTCNTANREGSKFCNECGTNLSNVSLLRCPNCGDMNPSTRTHCANCGTRLVVQAEPEPEDLPEDEAPLTPAAAPISTEPTPASDEPEWLRQLRATVTTNQAPDVAAPVESAPIVTPSAIEPARDDEMPAWLQELHAATAPSHEVPPEPSVIEPPSATHSETSQPLEPPNADELPAWLSEMQPAVARPSEVSAAGSIEPAHEDELPEWLREVSESPQPSALSPQPTASMEQAPDAIQPTDEADLPDWLKEFRDSSTPTAATLQSERAQPTSELPSWLADLQSDEPSHAESEAAPTGELAAAELPDWLRELAPTPATASTEWSMDDVAIEELPDWLKPPAPAAKAAERTAPPVGADTLAPGVIPAWLQALRPGGIATASGDVIETSGLLAGIRGALPIEPSLARAHASEKLEPAPTTVPVGGFAELFAPQPPPPPVLLNRQVRQSTFRASWLALFVLIVFAAALAAFLPIPFLRDLRGAAITVHQPALDYYQTIEALRPNQTILVAFDYAGGTRAELDPQTRATLLHLLQNKQHIIALSFVPEGGAIAQDVLNGLNPANTQFAYPYSYGDTHINLGYRSSGDAALRSLADSPLQLAPSDFTGKPLSSWPLTKDWKSLSSIAVLIVFSDSAEQVSRWVAQVERPTGKLMLAGVSALAGPEVKPFYDSKQIGGLLEGVRGAAEYEVLVPNPSTATATQDAISYIVIALVAVIVLGILFSLLRRRAA